MRTMPPVIGSVIALTMLMVSPTCVLAQAANAEEAEPWDRSPECIGAPVRDAPFSAEAVTVWFPPANSGKAELRSTARYYRDRAGRVRVEFVGGMTPHRVMITLDAGSPVAYLLETVARTAMRMSRQSMASIVGGGCFDDFVLPLSMNRVVSFFGRPLDNEPLGERSMAGLQVTGTAFTMRLPVTVADVAFEERWVSPDLRLVVYSRREDSVVGVVEHQVGKISRTEPPAHLFEVPADYVETAFPTCMTWENPYAPKPIRTGCGD